ncbi:peptidyl-tRNA hydrolase [Meredithblackwellia eburnea MCA 4105]
MALPPRLFVIVGLGNYPYPNTRHSIGQLLVASLATKAATLPGASGSPNLVLNAGKTAWTSQLTLETPPTPPTPTATDQPLRLLFVRPRALMNISGPAIQKAITGFLPSPFSTYRICTLQDDLDLAPSVLKIQRGGSPRGHNGVRSLERTLGTRDFWRIRIGVGRPEKKGDVPQWVMGALGRDEVRSVEFDGEGWEGAAVKKAWEEIEKMAWAQEEE